MKKIVYTENDETTCDILLAIKILEKLGNELQYDYLKRCTNDLQWQLESYLKRKF